MATTRTRFAGKASFGSWESEERGTRRGAPFFARSPARGDFAARKGCFCPCTVQGASQRDHSLSQKRMAPLEPQEKGLDWQSRARMTFVPPEWKCLRGGIASLAANGSARRFASAPTTRCCAAVGGSAALRMRHTPCGCRSAYLVGVQPNFRLPPVSTMRRAQQCRYFARQSAAEKTSLTPHDSKARLIVVTIRRDSWRSHVHRTRTAQRVQSFKLQTANVRGQGARPLAFSWGDKGVFSHVREYPPYPVQRLRRCLPRGTSAANPSHLCEKGGSFL